MKIFLDSSDVEAIQEAYDTGLIDGVTTNPTLILRNGGDPKEVLQDITEIFPWDASISAEVVGRNAEEMLAVADDYLSIAQNITIKVPCNVEGLKACRDLANDDIPVNVTLVFSTAQAILAAKAGAKYVSPFVGRVEDNSFEALSLVKDICFTFEKHKVETEVLAASLRDVFSVSKCFMAGANIVTMPPKIFWGMYNHILTEKGLQLFDKDWEEVLERNKHEPSTEV